MRLLTRFPRLQAWSQDNSLRAILKNSSYLFGSNTISIVLSMLQGILAARLLGAATYGLVVAVVIPFVSNVHRLLSFRMSELVVKYFSQYLVEGDRTRAGSIVKGAALAEALTSGVAYLVLLVLSPWAANNLAHNSQASSMILVYGMVLLFNGTYETALGVLQSSRQFLWIARVNLLQNIITSVFILVAFISKGSMWHILLAYLVGKGIAGLTLNVVALRRLHVVLGAGWSRAPMRLPWSEVSRFAVSTNLHATINLVVRDSETLLIGALRSTAEAGYFKIALGVINLVLMPVEPLIATTYAEISHSISQRAWTVTRRLIRRVSAISGLWTVLASASLVLVGFWLIPFVYGAEYQPAYPALVPLLVGYGIANIFIWNRSLLLALQMPTYPLKVSGLTGMVKTILTLLLVPVGGYVIEAVILSGYFASSILWMAYRGVREIKARELSAASV